MPAKKKPTKGKTRFRPAFAMSKQELARQLAADRIASIEVTQEADGSYWVGVRLEGLSQLFFLATKREVAEPRRFVRLDVLVAFLKRSVRYVGAVQVSLVRTEDQVAPRYKTR